MSQSNDGPHLSPTWIRSEYLGVSVPSLEGDSTATARLPALMVRPRPAGTLPGPHKHVIRALGQMDTGATSSAVTIWLL